MIGYEEDVVTQTTNFQTGEATFSVDRSGVIVLWNPAAEKTFGYPASTALGQRCWQLLCGHDTYENKYCSRFCPLREMAFQNEPVNGFQVTYQTASEGRKRFSISCLTVFNESGNEQLLHICRPVEETLENNHKLATTTQSANKHLAALTRRELEVLTLMADGENTRKIASMMGISTSTVRNHVQHVLNKLHVHTRLEAVMLIKNLDLT